MNIFEFHSVGQGLFYSGQIDGYRFVYDCGALSTLRKTPPTTNNEPALFKAIDQYSNKNEGKYIDLLVVSHLDADHVNGILELASRLKIKKVVLPYFMPILLRSFVFKAYLLVLGLDRNAYDYFLDGYEKAMSENTETNSDIIFEDTQFFLYPTKHSEAVENWQFVFLNNPYNISPTQIQSLEANIVKLLNAYGISDLVEGFHDFTFISNLKKIFKTIFSYINQTSLVMIHYPLIYRNVYYEFDWFFERKYLFLRRETEIYPPSVTMLTGDINFDKTGSMAVEVNDEIILSNLSLQVCSLPHHGSYYNFISFISCINISNSNLVMNYGLKNIKSKFPDFRTITEINKIPNRLIYVYEYSNYIYEIIT
ncbi:MAG: hypothetical protein AB7U79_02385 [Candidatus Izemoplasmatales bacterium]